MIDKMLKMSSSDFLNPGLYLKQLFIAFKPSLINFTLLKMQFVQRGNRKAFSYLFLPYPLKHIPQLKIKQLTIKTVESRLKKTISGPVPIKEFQHKIIFYNGI